MRRALLVVCAMGGAAHAKPASVFGGVITAELPRGWRVDGSRFVKRHGNGEISVDVGITNRPAKLLAKGFEEDAFDDLGAPGGVREASVGGVRGLVDRAGSDESGAVFEAVDACLGTITIRAVWFDDESAAERAEIRAIVKSVKLHVAGGGFRDEDVARVDPKARALADQVAEALCADDVKAFVALAAPSVRIRDAGHRELARDTLRGEIQQVGGLRAYAAMPGGPFSLALRDDGSVDLFTIAAAPAGAKDTGFVTLREVNGAWWIAGIARTLDSSP